MADHSIIFQFISEPTDVNFGGKVHGGEVMKWIDQTAYVCARNWAETYCVTVYVGGIRFYKPISIGDIIRIEAKVILTGNTSIHIAVDVFSRDLDKKELEKKTHCIIVFVSVDAQGKPLPVKQWKPQTEQELQMQSYALKLKELRENIEKEMGKFL